MLVIKNSAAVEIKTTSHLPSHEWLPRLSSIVKIVKESLYLYGSKSFSTTLPVDGLDLNLIDPVVSPDYSAESVDGSNRTSNLWHVLPVSRLEERLWVGSQSILVVSLLTFLEKEKGHDISVEDLLRQFPPRGWLWLTFLVNINPGYSTTVHGFDSSLHHQRENEWIPKCNDGSRSYPSERWRWQIEGSWNDLDRSPVSLTWPSITFKVWNGGQLPCF